MIWALFMTYYSQSGKIIPYIPESNPHPFLQFQMAKKLDVD